jgi:hypothetical protein
VWRCNRGHGDNLHSAKQRVRHPEPQHHLARAASSRRVRGVADGPRREREHAKWREEDAAYARGRRRRLRLRALPPPCQPAFQVARPA